ncbi:MAG: PhaP protein, partial [Caryophanon sp.]|nr:PhaP protein [Caryophanon sp.]
MANEFVTKSVDALWDNWLNGFKSLQQVQVEAEKKTLEALEVQQQLVEKTVQSLAAVEAQSKQFAEQWQQTVK